MIYYTDNKVKRLKRVYSGNAGIKVLSDIRYFEKIDPEFKKFRKNVLKDEKVERERTERSIRRTRKRIQEVLEANLDDKSFFLTLTYADEMNDYKKSNNRFNYWARQKNKNLKYLCVKELQTKNRDNVIHYHLVVFDVDNIDELAKTWSYGFYYFKEITNKYAYSMANYFTKYFTKDKNQLIDNGYRIMTTSTNLKKPIIIDRFLTDYIMKKFNYDIDIKKFEFLEYYNSIDIAKAWFGESKVKVL